MFLVTGFIYDYFFVSVFCLPRYIISYNQLLLLAQYFCTPKSRSLDQFIVCSLILIFDWSKSLYNYRSFTNLIKTSYRPIASGPEPM